MRRSALLAFSLLSLPACFFGQTSCFVRGTLVRTPHGNVPIESLRVGDEVLSFRTEDHSIVVRRVTHLLSARVPAVRSIGIAGATITTTGEHPFWDAERRVWTPARDLVAGTVLMRLDAEGRTQPAIVEWARDEARPETEVFNITVEGPEHNYFAGDIGVHNKEPACAASDCATGPDPAGPVPVVPNGEAVSVQIQGLSSDVVIDQAVLDGTLPVPISMALAVGTPRSTRASDSTPLQLDGWVTVSTGSVASLEPAAIVTIEQQPGGAFLVVGRGGVSVVRAGKGYELRPNVPAEMKVVPLDRGVDECIGGSPKLKLQWSGVPAPSATGFLITEQTWNDATSCVTVELSEPAVSPFRACLPSEAWPFAPGQTIDLAELPSASSGDKTLRVRGADEAGMLIELTLERLAISDPDAGRVSGGVKLVLDEAPDCAIVDATCGDTRIAAVPAALFGTRKTKLVLRTSFDVPGTDGHAKKWIVSASGTPIANRTCPAGDLPRSRQTVEVVTLVR